MQSNHPSPGPVTLAERILFIDILRGMALFGILAANMRSFFAPIDAYDHIQVLFPGRADRIAQGFIDIFIQGKFISIFSFLFGLGFAMQMSRAEARGVSFLGFYPRRLIALGCFGLIHGMLIWSGDILLTYALAGGILLLFRHREQKTLLYWAAGLFSAPIVLSTGFFAAYELGFRRPWMIPPKPDLHKLHDIINIYAHGSLAQIMKQNLVEWKDELPLELFAFYAVGLFLLGMWVWRARIVQNLDQYRDFLKKFCAWCLTIGFLGSLYVGLAKAFIPPATITVWARIAGMIWLPSSHILAAGYVSGLALIYLRPGTHPALRPFAAVGRMALTNYLMQSILCTWFFYSFGTGLYGQVGPAQGLIFTAVLYTAQLILSNWWLSRYRFGPMEWLWRGLTYGSFPVMRPAVSG